MNQSFFTNLENGYVLLSYSMAFTRMGILCGDKLINKIKIFTVPLKSFPKAYQHFIDYTKNKKLIQKNVHSIYTTYSSYKHKIKQPLCVNVLCIPLHKVDQWLNSLTESYIITDTLNESVCINIVYHHMLDTFLLTIPKEKIVSRLIIDCAEELFYTETILNAILSQTFAFLWFIVSTTRHHCPYLLINKITRHLPLELIQKITLNVNHYLSQIETNQFTYTFMHHKKFLQNYLSPLEYKKYLYGLSYNLYHFLYFERELEKDKLFLEETVQYSICFYCFRFNDTLIKHYPKCPAKYCLKCLIKKIVCKHCKKKVTKRRYQHSIHSKSIKQKIKKIMIIDIHQYNHYTTVYINKVISKIYFLLKFIMSQSLRQYIYTGGKSMQVDTKERIILIHFLSKRILQYCCNFFIQKNISFSIVGPIVSSYDGSKKVIVSYGKYNVDLSRVTDIIFYNEEIPQDEIDRILLLATSYHIRKIKLNIHKFINSK